MQFSEAGIRLIEDIQINFCMIVVGKNENDIKIYPISHRVSSGRMYYRKNKSGIIFCSTMRPLVKFAVVEINHHLLIWA